MSSEVEEGDQDQEESVNNNNNNDDDDDNNNNNNNNNGEEKQLVSVEVKVDGEKEQRGETEGNIINEEGIVGADEKEQEEGVITKEEQKDKGEEGNVIGEKEQEEERTKGEGEVEGIIVKEEQREGLCHKDKGGEVITPTEEPVRKDISTDEEVGLIGAGEVVNEKEPRVGGETINDNEPVLSEGMVSSMVSEEEGSSTTNKVTLGSESNKGSSVEKRKKKTRSKIASSEDEKKKKKQKKSSRSRSSIEGEDPEKKRKAKKKTSSSSSSISSSSALKEKQKERKEEPIDQKEKSTAIPLSPSPPSPLSPPSSSTSPSSSVPFSRPTEESTSQAQTSESPRGLASTSATTPNVTTPRDASEVPVTTPRSLFFGSHRDSTQARTPRDASSTSIETTPRAVTDSASPHKTPITTPRGTTDSTHTPIASLQTTPITTPRDVISTTTETPAETIATTTTPRVAISTETEPITETTPSELKGPLLTEVIATTPPDKISADALTITETSSELNELLPTATITTSGDVNEIPSATPREMNELMSPKVSTEPSIEKVTMETFTEAVFAEPTTQVVSPTETPTSSLTTTSTLCEPTPVELSTPREDLSEGSTEISIHVRTIETNPTTASEDVVEVSLLPSEAVLVVAMMSSPRKENEALAAESDHSQSSLTPSEKPKETEGLSSETEDTKQVEESIAMTCSITTEVSNEKDLTAIDSTSAHSLEVPPLPVEASVSPEAPSVEDSTLITSSTSPVVTSSNPSIPTLAIPPLTTAIVAKSPRQVAAKTNAAGQQEWEWVLEDEEIEVEYEDFEDDGTTKEKEEAEEEGEEEEEEAEEEVEEEVEDEDDEYEYEIEEVIEEVEEEEEGVTTEEKRKVEQDAGVKEEAIASEISIPEGEQVESTTSTLPTTPTSSSSSAPSKEMAKGMDIEPVQSTSEVPAEVPTTMAESVEATGDTISDRPREPTTPSGATPRVEGGDLTPSSSTDTVVSHLSSNTSTPSTTPRPIERDPSLPTVSDNNSIINSNNDNEADDTSQLSLVRSSSAPLQVDLNRLSASTSSLPVAGVRFTAPVGTVSSSGEKKEGTASNSNLNRLRANTTKIRSMTDVLGVPIPPAPVVSSAAASVIIKQGNLNKLDGGKWSKRWFVISGCALREYKKAKDKTALSEIPLSTIVELTAQDDPFGKTGQPFQLIVISRSGALLLSAKTQKDREDWRIRLLDHIVAKAYLVIHLPSKEITKLPYDGTTPLSELMSKICSKRNLVPEEHQFQIVGTTTTISKDQSFTLGDLGISEIQVVPLEKKKQPPPISETKRRGSRVGSGIFSSKSVAAGTGEEKKNREVLRTGWMVIQEKKSWKRRCFVFFLQPTKRISYYKADFEKVKDQKPKGTIELSAFKTVTDLVLPQNPTAPAFQWTLTSGSSKPLVIIAESEKQRELWTKSITKHAENIEVEADPLASYYPEGWQLPTTRS